MAKEKLQSIEHYHLKEPLYNIVEFECLNNSKGEIVSFLDELSQPKESMDTFCVKCNKERLFYACVSKTFIEDWIKSTGGLKYVHDKIVVNEFKCSKVDAHRIYFLFRIDQIMFTKIGQHPTLYDLKGYDIDRFKKILGTENLNEFRIGVQLASHGNGIGAFTYLRRIIEPLIEDAHQIAKAKEGEWDEVKYSKKEYRNKIKMLKGYLPEFLIQNNSMYSILSAGIHSLSESKCKEGYKWILQGIEYILTEKIRMVEDEKLKSHTQSKINNLHSEIKNEHNNSD